MNHTAISPHRKAQNSPQTPTISQGNYQTLELIRGMYRGIGSMLDDYAHQKRSEGHKRTQRTHDPHFTRNSRSDSNSMHLKTHGFRYSRHKYVRD
tara:strand:+ start:5063 stop:5347 length:285 start_codon:yes stop_codon:yes gene_type:complete